MCVRSHIHTAFSSFIQPFTDTVYFYVLAVVNNTPVNIRMQISLQDISFGVYLEVELLGHMLVLFFFLSGTSIVFPMADVSIYIPPSILCAS